MIRETLDMLRVGAVVYLRIDPILDCTLRTCLPCGHN